eukprot:scaffold196023_cov13-Tisochrysis_lutea.AAC.1
MNEIGGGCRDRNEIGRGLRDTDEIGRGCRDMNGTQAGCCHQGAHAGATEHLWQLLAAHAKHLFGLKLEQGRYTTSSRQQ